MPYSQKAITEIVLNNIKYIFYDLALWNIYLIALPQSQKAITEIILNTLRYILIFFENGLLSTMNCKISLNVMYFEANWKEKFPQVFNVK